MWGNVTQYGEYHGKIARYFHNQDVHCSNLMVSGWALVRNLVANSGNMQLKLEML